jgi:hypothetical protein
MVLSRDFGIEYSWRRGHRTIEDDFFDVLDRAR